MRHVSLGEVLREQLEELGKDRLWLAEQTGLPKITASSLLTDSYRPSPAECEAIAALFPQTSVQFWRNLSVGVRYSEDKRTAWVLIPLGPAGCAMALEHMRDLGYRFVVSTSAYWYFER